ncbi:MULTISPECIES: DUF3006 domain-containing protein [unclassified Ruminococcus]|uniref:DUF3006 domain-containing protein n=1 Tax=unclassified Ruminococcus TaxID=2608920 RepID=UPI002109D2DB|nr:MULTISPECIES: DUF3006 domain-containing protein [unclassified Ruminococcus]MCQ4022732.1 DUF3006 family protein [Ruminococcus sp. zg-924]MCQ4114972.1 DUF3006 family protein [Ruminococcus sp. zg-921]
MDVIIDRFEEGCAVVEIDENTFVNLPLPLVPKGAKEGSVISIKLDSKSTETRHKEINSLMNKLFKD